PDGAYRVGPLARLNVCSRMGTRLADRELAEYRQRGGGTVNASFFFHYARLIEVLCATEKIEELLTDPDLHSHRLRARAGVDRVEGVGVIEAPRGALCHHLQVDEAGLPKSVILITATGPNGPALVRAVAHTAQPSAPGLNRRLGRPTPEEPGAAVFGADQR